MLSNSEMASSAALDSPDGFSSSSAIVDFMASGRLGTLMRSLVASFACLMISFIVASSFAEM